MSDKLGNSPKRMKLETPNVSQESQETSQEIETSQETHERSSREIIPVGDHDPASDSSSPDGKGLQKKISALIQSQTSAWKLNVFEDENRFDLLELLNIEIQYEPMETFLSKIEDSIYILQYANPVWRDQAFQKAEGEYSLFLENNLDLDIQDNPGWNSTSDSGQIPFGAYPNNVDMQTKENVIRSLKTSMEKLAILAQRPRSEWPMRILGQCATAREFVERTLKFLSIQDEAAEGSSEELFVTFCRMVGLHFVRGFEMTSRKVNVLGIDVSSQPDLRAFSEYVTDFEVTKEFPKLKPTVIAEVKMKIPSERKIAEAQTKMPTRRDSSIKSQPQTMELTHLEEHLGQLVGELLAEVKDSKYNKNLFGMCIQGTRVQIVFLHLNANVERYIFSDGSDPTLKHHCEPGKLYITEARDFLKKGDRKVLMDICRKLGIMSSS